MIGETPKYLINTAIIIGKIKVYLFIFADLAILYTEINKNSNNYRVISNSQ